MLSAQTTDVNVNRVTATLFEKYRSPEDYLAVPERSSSATSSRRASTARRRSRSEGRCACCSRSSTARCRARSRADAPARRRAKTANVVAAELGRPQGVVVDTHVRRLSQRLGLTKQEDPVKIERDLMKLVPREDWGAFPHLLIWHGRRVCIARARAARSAC
jgi:endonuclease-3